MIYVLTALCGQEAETAAVLHKKGYKAYAPRAVRRKRHIGAADFIAETLFSGYIFIELEHPLTAGEYYDICSVKTVGKFLSRSSCLSDTEAEYIRTVYNNGETIGISKGIAENGRLRITSGWCKKFENHIVRWSARQHKAVVEVTLYGKPHRITCTVDIEKT